MIRQRHLHDRFVTAQSKSHAVIGNGGRPIQRDTVINCLRERGFHYRRPARCQTLILFVFLNRVSLYLPS